MQQQITQQNRAQVRKNAIPPPNTNPQQKLVTINPQNKT